ncbi:MAG TPA: hypothetical protein VGD68_08730 [Streptosporangiaceae bacterium]
MPSREPVGWAIGYTDFDAAASFASQATGWSHREVAIIGLAAGVLYSAALGAVLLRAWVPARSCRGGAACSATRGRGHRVASGLARTGAPRGATPPHGVTIQGRSPVISHDFR